MINRTDLVVSWSTRLDTRVLLGLEGDCDFFPDKNVVLFRNDFLFFSW